jgi:hypothetical protein
METHSAMGTPPQITTMLKLLTTAALSAPVCTSTGT